MGTQRSPSTVDRMELVASNYVAESTSPIDPRNLGSLAHVAQLQYQRQIKTLQTLQRQAELTAESNAAWRERERRREEKYGRIDQERQAQREQQAEINTKVAENRAARHEAALRHEEAIRAAAAAKVQAAEDRLARFKAERADHAIIERERIAAVEARREATYRNNLELLEERREAILAKERRLEDILRQREELRQLQAQIKAEEDYLREQQRRAIKSKAEEDLAERVAHFHAKNTAKDELAARRKKAIEDSRRMRGDELRQRFEYIAAQANEAAALAQAERQALAERIEDKVARGEALAVQRAALLAEMQNLRQQMQRQEEVLRGSLLRMRQAGSVAIPEEVALSLEAMQLGGPVMATAVLGGGRSQLLLEGPPGAESEELGSPSGRGRSAKRRPKSAGTTPRSARGMSPAEVGGRSLTLGAMTSPRGPQAAGRARRHLADPRPFSASPDPRRTTGAPATPTRHHTTTTTTVTATTPATAPVTAAPIAVGPSSPGVIPTPAPYSPYTLPGARSRAKQPTVEEQVAAATSTAEQAAEALVSGQYTGVHEVARPGSRREEELRQVLQEEIAKESERQSLLAKVTDDAERTRLIKYFTLEREEAKRRILALSNAAQAALYH